MEGWALAIPVIGLVIVAVAIYTLWRIIKSKKSGFPFQMRGPPRYLVKHIKLAS